MEINFVFLCGKGCSGKDTQSHLLKTQLGESAIELSTGEIFRDATAGKGFYARFKNVLKPHIEHVNKYGGLIPDEIIINIVESIVEEKVSEGIETFIFTGFPRTEEQRNRVDELIRTIEGAKSQYVHFDISDETSKLRAEIRRKDCQSMGIPERDDDNLVTVEKRLRTYRELTYPMLLKLDQQNLLISIDAEASIPEIERETRVSVCKEKF